MSRTFKRVPKKWEIRHYSDGEVKVLFSSSDKQEK
jgi:hypothetical protein